MLAHSERYGPRQPVHPVPHLQLARRPSHPVLILKHQPFLQPLPLVIPSSITTRRRFLLSFATRSLLCRPLSPSLLLALRDAQTPLSNCRAPWPRRRSSPTFFVAPNRSSSHRSLSHYGTLAALEPADLRSQTRLRFTTVANRDLSTQNMKTFTGAAAAAALLSLVSGQNTYSIDSDGIHTPFPTQHRF